MNKTENLTLYERLQGLVDLLPAFQEREDEQKTKPFLLRSSPLIYKFHKVAYEYNWVQGFNWPDWKQTPEAEMLRDNPEILAQATEEQLVRLITTCVRQERFCGGSLEATYRSGLMIDILRRAASLLGEIEQREKR